MKKSEEAFNKVFEIYSRHLCSVPEANREYNDANRAVISALNEEHPGNVLLFKFHPGAGKSHITIFDPKVPVKNFSCNYVVPNDPIFVEAIEEYKKNGFSLRMIDVIGEAAEKCGGYPLNFV